VTVVGLVPDVAGRREGDGAEHPAVALRVAVEVDHRQEVGRLARAVAGPDVERPRIDVVLVRIGVVAVVRVVASGARRRRRPRLGRGGDDRLVGGARGGDEPEDERRRRRGEPAPSFVSHDDLRGRGQE
jgi:hypothetical protein